MLFRDDFPKLTSGEFDSLTLEWTEKDLALILVDGPEGEWAVECVFVEDDGVTVWQVTDPMGVIVQTGATLEQSLVDIFAGALLL